MHARIAAIVLLLSSASLGGCAAGGGAGGAPGFSSEGRSAERLLVQAPAGYVVAHQGQSPRGRIVEFVPNGQTVDNWTDMVTVQVFPRQKASSQEFATHMRTTWQKTCGPFSVRDQSALPINGYPSNRWLATCDLNPKTRQPESAAMVSIRGTEALYVVQVATKAKPEPDWTARTKAYLDTVLVCDAGTSEHPCPRLKRHNER